MTSIFNKFNAAAVRFAKEEEGAQVVEYALIIAVVSIGLISALELLGGVDFTNFVGRVSDCLRTGNCAAPAL
jgi:pilus assembly protein Flp/PilA